MGCCSLEVCVYGAVIECVKKVQVSEEHVSQCRCVSLCARDRDLRAPAVWLLSPPGPRVPPRAVRPAPQQVLCTSASLTETLSRQAVERGEQLVKFEVSGENGQKLRRSCVRGVGRGGCAGQCVYTKG